MCGACGRTPQPGRTRRAARARCAAHPPAHPAPMPSSCGAQHRAPGAYHRGPGSALAPECTRRAVYQAWSRKQPPQRSRCLQVNMSVGRESGPRLQHHARQDVVQDADGVLALVIGRDGDVDVRNRGVCVAERDHRDVHVRRLAHRLVVRARVGHDQQPRLLKVLLALVGERACAARGSWSRARS